MTDSLRTALLFRYGQFLTVLERHGLALECLRRGVRGNPRHQQGWNCVGFRLAERLRVEFGGGPR